MGGHSYQNAPFLYINAIASAGQTFYEVRTRSRVVEIFKTREEAQNFINNQKEKF